MCNAKNHRWNCKCGFGRTGQLAEVIPGTGSDLFFVPRLARYDTKSNAQCPVCGAAVFFFKLVNDGRVFFDEIGPPWPKHPCTDNTSEFNAEISNDDGSKWPFVENVLVKEEGENILRLSGKVQDKNLVIYVRNDAFNDESMPAMQLSESFIQVRFRSDGKVDLALLNPAFRPLLIRGYGTAKDAESENS